MVIERRDSARVHVAWKATVTRLNGEQLTGSTDNVSYSGINVILGKDLVVGEPVKLDVVAKAYGGLRYFRLEGVVIHNRDMDGEMGSCASVGLRFITEPADLHAFLTLICQPQLIAKEAG